MSRPSPSVLDPVVPGRVDSRGKPGGRTLAVVAVLALIWSVGVFGAFLYTAVARPGNFTGVYNASAYWVTYEEGFIRRGLIGTVAGAVLGHPLDAFGATVLGVVLVAIGFVALLWLVWATLVTAQRPVRLLAVAIVVASPFTFSLLVQTRGRYDAVVVLCIALVAISFLVGSQDERQWLRVVAVAALNALGVGAEEFALGFLAPLTVLGVLRMGGGPGRALVQGVLALAPAFALAVLSSVRPPRLGYLAELTERVRGAGLPLDPSEESSISALGQTTKNALAFTTGISPLSIALCTAVLGGCYLLSSIALWVCCGRPYPRPIFVLIAVYAVAALGMSAAGDDYRRWWGLAFVAMAVSTFLLAAGGQAASRHSRRLHLPDRRPAVLAAIALLVASAAVQLFPLYPTWDPAANIDLSIDYLRSHQ